VRKTRLAAYFFATTRGIPQFYYGTEILMSNTGDDSHGNIRSDFPGGWAEDGDDVNGFASIGLTEEAQAFQAELRALLNWRRTATAVHEGTLKHYVPMAGSYVYFRESSEQTIMVILNQGDASESLELARFDEVLRGRRGLVDALTGESLKSGETLEVPGWKAWVLVVQD
jgi:glycosidase